nr:PEPxxWA-CTERM sorting domain-containing protein [Sandarakinorhabdus sp.]
MKKFLLVCVAAAAIAAPASAATFVGSWRVDAGPSWTGGPIAYTGQAAAALLFGGTASQYRISTIDSNVANIDNLAWVSTYGGACGGTFPCGTKVAHNSVNSSGGFYLAGGNQSAYVQDWAVGPQYVNYAFFDAVPESSTWAMLIAGFGLVGASMRRRKAVLAA